MLAILVTGVAGFIGHHVAMRLLRDGHHVIGIDSLNAYYDPVLKRDRMAALRAAHGARLDFHRIDFADMQALANAVPWPAVERIVHLGAQAGVRHSIANPQAYVHSNLVGHANLLEMAHRAGRCGHMVYASSSSVYGGNRHLPFAVDDRADHPMSVYAATKRANELMSETYAHLYRLPQTGLRFFTVYGPWGRPDMAVWLFAEAILRGKPVRLFNHGRMKRDFTYIDDISDGVIACLDAPPADNGMEKPGGSLAPHAIYNIGSSHSENVTDMVALLEQATGRTARREMLPMQPGEIIETYADIEPIRHDHGYRPHIGIEQGIPLFVDWLKHYRGMH